MSKFTIVGEYKKEYNDLLGVDYKLLPIVCSKGLKGHLIKRKHFDTIEYIDKLGNILGDPDYIALSTTTDNSFLAIKKLDKNVTVAVKLNSKSEKYYVATIYSVTDAYIERKICAGQYKPLTKNDENNIISASLATILSYFL